MQPKCSSNDYYMCKENCVRKKNNEGIRIFVAQILLSCEKKHIVNNKCGV